MFSIVIFLVFNCVASRSFCLFLTLAKASAIPPRPRFFPARKPSLKSCNQLKNGFVLSGSGVVSKVLRLFFISLSNLLITGSPIVEAAGGAVPAVGGPIT